MNILSAPTALGNRPYEDNGNARRTDEGPARVLDQGVAKRLSAKTIGEVSAAPYRDFVKPRGGIRNEDLVLDHVRRIAKAIEAHDDFTITVGGDCSVLLGCLLGHSRGTDLGLVYLDAHDDFNTEETTESGGVAGMCLAQATGRGRSELAHLRGPRALVRDDDVVTVGVREGNFAGVNFRRAITAGEILEHFGDREFFIHLDIDVLDPTFMPFVDSPTASGLTPATLTSILTPLVRNPRAVGMEVTLYDPRHDHDRRGAALIANILEESFRS